MTESADLKSRVLKRIDAAAPRSVWTPADVLDLGTRDAIDKVLQRLVAAGTLRRIGRGLYDKPDFNSLTKVPNPPDPRQVVEAIARRDQIRVLVDGMTAANDLGLTNAVPAKIIVHTDSRLKPVHLGNLDISFRPTAASKLFGRAVRRCGSSRRSTGCAIPWLTRKRTGPSAASSARYSGESPKVSVCGATCATACRRCRRGCRTI